MSVGGVDNWTCGSALRNQPNQYCTYVVEGVNALGCMDIDSDAVEARACVGQTCVIDGGRTQVETDTQFLFRNERTNKPNERTHHLRGQKRGRMEQRVPLSEGHAWLVHSKSRVYLWGLWVECREQW